MHKTVVFATVGSLAEIEQATWRDGDDESYTNTQRLARREEFSIALVGRRSKVGVEVLYAAYGRHGQWRKVNTWTICLAKYFALMFAARPPGRGRLAPFFTVIDDESAAYAARQLTGLEGADDRAVNKLNADLEALGIPAGDWTAVPIKAAISAGAPRSVAVP